MEQEIPQVIHDFPFFRVYSNGRFEKLRKPAKKIAPFDDHVTGVRSKDVTISTDPEISARIFLPRLPNPTRKLPLLLYIHGGGYCHDSAFSGHYHRHVSALSSGADVIAVSVEYRLAPDHPLPACYNDAWAALQWIAAHGNRTGPDPWLNSHADLGHVFLGGDSAGANIAHNLGYRVGSTRLPKIRLSGMFLVHPMFGGIEKDDRMWMYLCPTNSGRTDPKLNPPALDLAQIQCGRVLVMVAEKDYLNPTGRCYYWNLKRSGWRGTVELVESRGEDHCFHLYNKTNENVLDLVRRIVLFIKQGSVESSL